jgi:hypothetical protein
VTGSQDHTARIHTAFPWNPDDYPGDPAQTLHERMAQYKSECWTRLAGEARSRKDPKGNSLSGVAREVETRDRGEFYVPAGGETRVRPARPIPGRDPRAGPDQIDLSGQYNAALNEPWQPAVGLDDAGQDLSRLPLGLHSLGGVVFDIRGVIQLGRSGADWSTLPTSVCGVQVGRRLRQIHLLHGTAHREREGAVIGSYRLNYEDGQTREIEICYGRDVRDWWGSNDPKPTGGRSQVVWTTPVERTLGQYIDFVPGPHAAADSTAEAVRLFKTTYDNPRPSETVVSLDFTSTLTQSAPFVVAITVE